MPSLTRAVLHKCHPASQSELRRPVARKGGVQQAIVEEYGVQVALQSKEQRSQQLCELLV